MVSNGSLSTQAQGSASLPRLRDLTLRYYAKLPHRNASLLMTGMDLIITLLRVLCRHQASAGAPSKQDVYLLM